MKRLPLYILLALLLTLQACSQMKFYSNYNVDRATHRDSKHIPAYLNAMSDPDLKMRMLAFRNLGTVGVQAASAVEKVKKQCLNDSSADVRRYCVDCLRQINPGWHDTEIFLSGMLESEQNKEVIDFIEHILHNGYPNHTKDMYIVEEDSIFSNGGSEIFKGIRVSFQPQFRFFNGHKEVRIVQQNRILPLKIIIENNSPVDLFFLPNDLVIRDRFGNAISEINPDEVYNTQNYSMAKSFWSGRANNRIEAHLNDIEDDELRLMAKYSSIDGILFYNVADTLKSLWNWQIAFSFINPETNQKHQVSYLLGESVSVVSTKVEYNFGANNIKSVPTESIEDKLEKLKSMKDKGLITDSDYNKKKNELLESF